MKLHWAEAARPSSTKRLLMIARAAGELHLSPIPGWAERETFLYIETRGHGMIVISKRRFASLQRRGLIKVYPWTWPHREPYGRLVRGYRLAYRPQ